jgi:ribosomal protein S27E
MQLDRKESFISFRCDSCEQEIEASLDRAGTPLECPVCGHSLRVPLTPEPGTRWALAADQNREGIAALKGRTIRIELSDVF